MGGAQARGGTECVSCSDVSRLGCGGGSQEAARLGAELAEARRRLAASRRQVEARDRKIERLERQAEGPRRGGDPRDAFVARSVPGKSFADVGGLYGTVAEKVSVAHRAGAASVEMVDVVPFSDPMWAAFEGRMGELGISGYWKTSASVLEMDASYDAVHCSGVLYHMPEPMALLRALHRISREAVVLGCVVSPRRMQNGAGVLEVPGSAAIHLPALSGAEKAVVAEHFRPLVGDRALGLTAPATWDPEDFSPWWWLPTSGCLRGACEAAGFSVLEEAPYWHDNARALLLRRR